MASATFNPRPRAQASRVGSRSFRELLLLRVGPVGAVEPAALRLHAELFACAGWACVLARVSSSPRSRVGSRCDFPTSHTEGRQPDSSNGAPCVGDGALAAQRVRDRNNRREESLCSSTSCTPPVERSVCTAFDDRCTASVICEAVQANLRTSEARSRLSDCPERTN